jgi:hypothetical protein
LFNWFWYVWVGRAAEDILMPAMRAPQRVYDFSDYSRTRPSAQQPGDRLDAQFADHALSIRSIIDHLRLERTPTDVGLDDLRRKVDAVVQSLGTIAAVARSRGEEAVARVEAYCAQVQAAFQAAVASADALRAEREAAGGRLQLLQQRVVELEARVSTALAPGVLGPNAGGFYGVDTLGAGATAQDWAQVSIEWAEHMPDTIPPNILAISAITGQHWSSRWWAQRAAAAFGGQMAYLYLGPQYGPPSALPSGGPIPVGAIYYDTGTLATYVWNGTGWDPFNTPQKSASSVLFYTATAGQTNFVLTANDMFGNASQALLADGSQGIEVWLDGARLTPSKGATVVDFTVNVASSTVTLTEGCIAGAVLAVDVLTPASAFAPSNVALVKIKVVPDGVTTTFPLIDVSNNPYHSNNAAAFVVAVDGSPQNPGVDYVMSGDGNSIVFSTAPAADSVVFVVIAY